MPAQSRRADDNDVAYRAEATATLSYPFFASLCLTAPPLACYRLLMAINLLAKLSLHQLHRAVAFKEQMAALEAELGHLFVTPASAPALVNRRGKWSRSAATKVRMS